MNLARLRALAILALAMLAGGLHAQTDEIAEGFRKTTPAEEQRLREVLAEPVPQGAALEALRRHFREKDRAAVVLLDGAAREAILREAISLLPDPVWKNNLARQLLDRGQFPEGNALARQAMADAGDRFTKMFFLANIACDLYDQGKRDESGAAIAEVVAEAKAGEADAKLDRQKLLLQRALGRSNLCLSLLEQRAGRYPQAVQAAQMAEQAARKAAALIPAADTVDSRAARTFLHADVAVAIARKLQASRAAGRLQDAENTLADYIRYSREVQLPASYLSGIYATAGNLRFTQREFVQSEQLMRKSDAVLDGLGFEPTSATRASRMRDIIIALAGQKKWPEALQEFDRLDRLAGDDASLKRRVLFRFDRAVVYFGNQRFAQAAPLFENVAQGNQRLYGESHFFSAQAAGLHGASLWRTGSAENRARALPLLKSAVRDYMAPANADFLENSGIRTELREIVFAAYLEAVSTTSGETPSQAIGAADWVRGGTVQEALSDAAVRAAASTPALADVVRREQDAKNEVAGIRRYLSGEAGGASSPLPQIATQMRERIAVLEGERVKLQADIKAKFPDYERLVRPTPPTVNDIAGQLDPQQALLLLLPTADAVYVWAVASDRPAAFVRANLTEAQVNALVTRLRQQLDFNWGPGVGSAFDNAAAFELYAKLLAPVASAWQGKTQLIVAAGGTLSQLPFGVLQTRAVGLDGKGVAGNGFAANAPWLIREASIAQVPSLSAWLAIKSIAKGKSASQAFVGWGDPAFSAKAAAAGATGSSAATQARSVTLTRATTLADLDALEKTTTAPSALKYADIPALPDTREELLAISATLKANTSRDVLLGSLATRDSVLAASKAGLLANKRVIAFATHGLMAGDLPNLNQPALAMAATGAEAQNPLAPLLTLEDVLTLKLNADWVVLSACNTAAADGKADEALSGLARGFFYAGSRSLLVTHWAVESESAKLLTTNTFEHYTANPQAPKAESLRQAMLKVMAMPKFAHPAFWAPYALVGDGGR